MTDVPPRLRLGGPTLQGTRQSEGGETQKLLGHLLNQKQITKAGSCSNGSGPFMYKPMKTIYVTVEGGLVHDVIDVPEGIEVVVIDYDVECEDADRLHVSPLDGEPCAITTFRKEECENPA